MITHATKSAVVTVQILISMSSLDSLLYKSSKLIHHCSF
nr:MAG TPA: hypothetical protein [Caudoviricetes sp.]